MRPGDNSRLAPLAVTAGVLGLALWAADDLKAWVHSWPWMKPAVQTFAPPAKVNCTLPTEHEQMVVVFYWRDGRLAHRCMFAGARGTYTRRPKATAL